MAKTIVKSSIDNIKRNILIFSNSNTSNKNMFEFILIYSCVVIPYPGALKTLFLKGLNIINFFN